MGLTGILAASISGRLIENLGSSASLLLGLACGVVAFSLCLISHAITGLVIGIVLLDFGLSIANVSNQSKILGLNIQARSRINTI